MAAAFYIAVEDDLSDAVVRRLLSHARRGFQVCGRYPLSPLAYLKPELSGYGYLKTNVQAFNKAAVETPHLLLTDLDVAACAPELIQEWIGGTLHPNFVLRVAVREVEAAHELDHNPDVAAWAKNDHLGFEIAYIFAGVFHKFRPDYLIRLAPGATLIVEIKGQKKPQDETKRRYLNEWVTAVNDHGGFGNWKAGLCLNPSDLPTVIQNAAREA